MLRDKPYENHWFSTSYEFPGRLPLEQRRSVFRRTGALMSYMKFCIPEYREVCLEFSRAAQEEAPDESAGQDIRRQDHPAHKARGPRRRPALTPT
jgi:hypothetical protein